MVEEGKCFGALTFDTQTCEISAHLADAVILCTGGHTKNWKRSSSRKGENNGDGYFLALKSGCELIDMEMVQFHPTGMLMPEEISGTLVTEAVRGEGGRLFNSEGERFMGKYDKERMELSTRDRIAFANYMEIKEGRSTKNGGVYLDISHKSKEFILKKIPKIYRQFIEYQMLDISRYAMEVAPTAHYSMGGIKVDAKTHSTNINGLYAAGEVAGGLHGANRLGGNSLAEILVFGRRAGKAASIYSKNLIYQKRSKECIQAALDNIKKRIKPGKELVLPLQKQLSEVMWEFCGVVKNENLLNSGIQKVLELKSILKEVDCRIDYKNCQDLINLFNLEASIFTSEATLKSSLIRKESRGAHFRSDFPNKDDSANYNLSSCLVNSEISIEILKKNPLREDLKEVINSTKEFIDQGERLLE